jgi:hypothetical protein
MEKNFFGLVLGLLLSIVSWACECDSLQPLSLESLKNYELIFVGHVSSITSCDEAGKARVLFLVDTLFRGKAFVGTEVQFDCSTSCAMSFAPEERWLIYSKYAKYGLAEVHLCSHSRKQAPQSKDDYAIFTQGNTFEESLKWLSENCGVQILNAEADFNQPSRELVHPDQQQSIWLIVGGLVTAIILYFTIKRFLR